MEKPHSRNPPRSTKFRLIFLTRQQQSRKNGTPEDPHPSHPEKPRLMGSLFQSPTEKHVATRFSMPCAPPPTSPGALLRQRKPGQMGQACHGADITTETRDNKSAKSCTSDFSFRETSSAQAASANLRQESLQNPFKVKGWMSMFNSNSCATLHRPSCPHLQAKR